MSTGRDEREDLRDLEDGELELYAIDALDEHEHRRVEATIDAAEGPERKRALRRIADARDAAAALVEGAGIDAEPPEGLRTAVLDGVARRPGTGVAGGPDAFRQRQQRRGDGSGNWWARGAIAAAAAALALGGGIAVVTGHGGEQGAEPGGGGGNPAGSSAPAGPGGASSAAPGDPASMAAEIMAASDAAVEEMPSGPDGMAKLMRSDDMNKAVIEFSGLPAPKDGMRYTSWFGRKGGSMVSGGAVAMGSDGKTVVASIVDLAGTSDVMITEEPMSGPPAAAPTGEPMAAVALD
ncbi:anti-sigma factor [Dietzia sp.]|uniref:anti-sigma factor n=1 Tax=Dietzia sp. TaxID=1871616 RepID=UPI002FDB3DCC